MNRISREQVFDRMWWSAELIPGIYGHTRARAATRRLFDGVADTAVAIGTDRKRRVRAPIVSVLIAGMIIGASSTPAKASDVPAFGERLALWFGEEYNEWISWAQQAVGYYRQYKGLYKLYQKVHSGNIGLTVDFAIPPVDVGFMSENGNGTSNLEAFRINPNRGNGARAGAPRGGGGVNVDFTGLRAQLQGLISGEWDFDMSTMVIDDETGQAIAKVDPERSLLNAQQDAVGTFMLANRIFTDRGFARKYFEDSSGVSLNGTYLQGKINGAVAKEAVAYQKLGNALGVSPDNSAMAQLVGAYATGIAEAGQNGLAAAELSGAQQDALLQAQNAHQSAYATYQFVADMVTNAGLQSDERQKDIKQWYDVVDGGKFNVWKFLMSSITPDNDADAHQGAKGASVSADAKVDKVSQILQIKSKMDAAQAKTESAQKIMDAARASAEKMNQAMQHDNEAEAADAWADFITAVAAMKPKFYVPITVVGSDGSSGVMAVSIDDDVDPQAAIDGATAAADLAGDAVSGIADALNTEDAFNEFQGIFKSLVGGVAAFFGVAFFHPSAPVADGIGLNTVDREMLPDLAPIAVGLDENQV